MKQVFVAFFCHSTSIDILRNKNSNFPHKTIRKREREKRRWIHEKLRSIYLMPLSTQTHILCWVKKLLLWGHCGWGWMAIVTFYRPTICECVCLSSHDTRDTAHCNKPFSCPKLFFCCSPQSMIKKTLEWILISELMARFLNIWQQHHSLNMSHIHSCRINKNDMIII